MHDRSLDRCLVINIWSVSTIMTGIYHREPRDVFCKPVKLCRRGITLRHPGTYPDDGLSCTRASIRTVYIDCKSCQISRNFCLELRNVRKTWKLVDSSLLHAKSTSVL